MGVVRVGSEFSHIAAAAAEPVVVDFVCQPLHEARAPVSEWIA